MAGTTTVADTKEEAGDRTEVDSKIAEVGTTQGTDIRINVLGTEKILAEDTTTIVEMVIRRGTEVDMLVLLIIRAVILLVEDVVVRMVPGPTGTRGHIRIPDPNRTSGDMDNRNLMDIRDVNVFIFYV